jgi:hypothetical protein
MWGKLFIYAIVATFLLVILHRVTRNKETKESWVTMGWDWMTTTGWDWVKKAATWLKKKWEDR